MKRYKCGYTQGVFDMFHIGHLNLINQAKMHCDTLIVGVNADALVENYKKKTPVIPEQNRCKIVENIKAVDRAVIADTLDKVEMYRRLGFDVVFIGDDWKNDSRWIETERELAVCGVDVVYLPYTQDISSTLLRDVEQNKVDG
jgi:cytidyltransferase-related domain